MSGEQSDAVNDLLRGMFYVGTTISLAFMMWLLLAPHTGEDPSWWNPSMARSVAAGILTMGIAGTLLIIRGLTNIVTPLVRTTGWFGAE